MVEKLKTLWKIKKKLFQKLVFVKKRLYIMSCTNPLKAFPIGETKTGKTQYKICDHKVHHLELDKNDTWIKCYDFFVSSSAKGFRMNALEVPCGKCDECRLAHSREWANRCLMELQYHKSSYFLTLTYDDEHIPYAQSADRETGELRRISTLSKSDFQKFVKRLRKQTGQKLRYFACGEYGGQTYRPHYHAIIFGLELSDLEFYKETEVGNMLYFSQTMRDIWQQGEVIIGEVTWESCAYTARYLLKKAGDLYQDLYDDFNLQKEFILMSRKPGIARQWLDDHPQILKYDHVSIATSDGGRQVTAPRYFKNLIPDDKPLKGVYQEHYDRLSDVNYSALIDKRNIEHSRTDKSLDAYLETKARIKRNTIKSLKRKEI